MGAERDPRLRARERAQERRKHELRRRRRVALGLALLASASVAALIALVAVPALSGKSNGSGGSKAGRRTRAATKTTTTTQTSRSAPPGGPFAVGVRTMRFVDSSRQVTYANGTTAPRVLNTEVRYPAVGRAGGATIVNAKPQLASGPFPLIVFGHGYALLPIEYQRLLNAWASAGYVVAAPIFPAENKDAPGGPDEDDLPNQPEDMSFVISEMLAAGRAANGPFSTLIDPEEIAVAGHSDGGDTALAVAYDEYEGLRNHAVKAAIILSGAEMRALPPIAFPSGGPALLATQGTADTINLPAETSAYFSAAKPPKYLLRMIGAEHYAPYMREGTTLRLVKRVSIDFLNAYLKRESGSLKAMSATGNVAGVATLQAGR